ncbi:helix-turn-helix domain-containing protein [Bifidobacterium longum]|uniref:helix-turn-helix domain-containing protein n=1 Tax=Bifidobacterium longum TaxID=216816 RepID=UPI001C395C6F|nr:helix-turn-helix domain-containing protein [Bifidobacterium longum]MBV3808615.1 helix-turn-helix domain-containing protein [Bifidobacterium longum]
MSWQCTSWALREAPAPTATARLVLIALADRCQPDGRSAWPTVDTLMLEAHTSESSVKRALKALEETGCIRRGNQKLAQWDEHGNYVPDPYRSVVWECCMNVTLEHVSEKPGRQARAERAERLESVDATDGAKGAGFRGVKMTPLENGGNKPKHRGVTGDTPIVRTNTSKQISPLPPTEASPRTGESRDGKNQTAHIIEAASAPDEANRPMGEPDDERWQDAGPEPEERVPAGIRARWILDRLENRRAAMGLTPKPAGRRDTDAVTRLVERLDAAGEPDTSGLMERVLDHALDNGFQAKRVDTGRRFARLFDELRDDLTCDQRTLERRRREHADASQPTGSDTGESRPAEPESCETRARRMLADRIGADIDASTAIRALADRLRLDPDPDPGQAARYAELALRAGRKTRAEQARRESERSRELHDYRASHGGSCFAGNWQLEQAA